MWEFLRKYRELGGFITAAMAWDGYRRSLNADSNIKVLASSMQRIEEDTKKVELMKSKIIAREDNLTSIWEKFEKLRIEEHVEVFNKNKAKLKTLLEDPDKNKTTIEYVERDSMEILNRISSEYQELDVAVKPKISDIITQASDIDNSSKLVGEYFNTFENYFNSFSTVEQGAIASLVFAITIYYFVIGIAIMYFGDKLIIFFKLEDKYPRLARWIRYRRTLQHYSIGFNIIGLLLITAYVAYVNILILLHI